MANPSITPLPQAPNRAMARTVYPVVADAWAAAIGPWTAEVNAVVTWMGKQVDAVAASAKAASDSATAAGQAVTDAQAQVKLATDQAVASKGSADAAARQLSSTETVAAAVRAQINLPSLAGKSGQYWRVAADEKTLELVPLIVNQVGDILASTQPPDTNWLLTNRSYSKAAYPALFSKLGQVPDWADNQINYQNLNSQDVYGCAAFGAGVFVVLRTNNGVGGSWSSDTITWTDFTFPAIGNGYFTSLVFGNGLFVGIQYNGSSNFSQYVTSPDGKNWTVRNLPSQPSGSYWYDIQWTGSVFIIQSLSTNEALVSSDAINWTKRTLPAIQLQQSVVTSNKLGMYWYAGSSTYYTTSDGVSWVARTFPFQGYNYWAFGNGRVAFILGNTMYVTSDAVTWTQFQIPTSPYNSNVTLFLVNESGFLLGFQAASGQAIYDYYTSVDGKKWTFRKAYGVIFVNSLSYRKGAYGNKTFVVPLAATSTQFLRLKPYNYDTVNQFFVTEYPNPIPGVENYIKAS